MNRSIISFRVLSVASGLIAAFAGNAIAAIFSNSASIALPAAGISSGSSISVSGIGNSLTSVTVEIEGFTDTDPHDLGLVVVGPTGAALVLQGAAGQSTGVSNLNVTYSDAGGLLIPQTGGLVSGTFKPTQWASLGSFPSPGPGLAYSSPAVVGTATLASRFDGINPNGTWSLYAIDAASGDSGEMGDGWSLQITAVPEPTSLSLIAVVGGCLVWRRVRNCSVCCSNPRFHRVI